MTEDAAREIAESLCGNDPLAVPLLMRMGDPDRGEAAKARAAIKAMWPAVFGAIPAEELREMLAKKPLRALWQGTKGALQALDRYSAADFGDRTTTGLRLLDQRMRGGLLKGAMCLLGAPTGGGKTSFVQQIAVAAAAQGRGTVLLVSPEMSLAALVEREIVRRSGRKLWDRRPWIGAGPVRDSCIAEHLDAARAIVAEKLPIVVLEETMITMSDVEKAAAEVGRGNLALIIIDYAQYVAGGADNTPRFLQVGDVGTQAVDLATKMDCPILVTSQVNVVEEKGGGRKRYTFRETSKLQHSAHTVLILDVAFKEEGGERIVEKAEIICEKQRDYAPFWLEIGYEPSLYRISEHVQAREWTPRSYQTEAESV